MIKSTDRLYSLDALRGFDMFWITGGAMIFHALANATDSGVLDWISYQCHHAEWDGFRFFDLIFPLFLFIAGVSFPFSLDKRRKKGELKRKIYNHIFKRGLILVALGVVYNGFFKLDFENLRYASVLGRIGLAWMFGALIFMNAGRIWTGIWVLGILLGYYAALTLIPVPGFGAGDLSMEGSLVGWVDRALLPGSLYRGVHDPEGILSTIPAIANALLGMLTGELLRIRSAKPGRYARLAIMAGSGTALILLALLWNLDFPINKNLWTSSFVLLTSGLSLLLLSFFYLVTDIWRLRSWAFVFVVIGLNPITIYMAQNGIIHFRATANYFFSGIIGYAPESFQPFWSALTYFVVSWLFLYFLYKRRWFLKV